MAFRHRKHWAGSVSVESIGYQLNIKIKVAAALREHLPGSLEVTKGRLELNVAEGITPADVIKLLNIPSEQRLMVIVDDAMVPRTEYNTLSLKANQSISLNPPIQAG